MRARGRHALKKAGKPRQWGNCSNGALNEIMQLVLDREEYRSSEDEDYLPGDSIQRQPGASPQTTAPGLAQEEEDLSLSERKKRLKQKQEGRDRVSAPHGMWNVPLPVEVVVMILRLAGAANAAPILATASCVCKAWRAAVRENPQLWHSLDLGYAAGRVTDSIVTRSAKTCWHHVDNLSFSGCTKLTDTALKVQFCCIKFAPHSS